jgi:predicted aspartyl protease
VSTAFDAKQGLVIISARLWGPTGDAVARLALDTGATGTLVRTAILVSLGLDPAAAPERIQVTTGSGVVYAPRIRVARISALERERRSFPILSHTLPPSAGIDGLLGLDFFRRRRLLIDFRQGRISLA